MRLVLSLLYRHTAAYPFMALGLLGTSVLTAAMWVVEPLYSSYAVDQLMALETTGYGMVARLIILWGCIFLVLSLSNAVQKYLEWWFALKVELDMTEEAYIHALRLPIAFHTSQKAGEVMKTVQDGASELASTLGRQMLDMSMSFAAALTFIGLSLWIEWRLALILLTVILFFISIVVVSTIRMAARQDEANRLWVKPSGRMFDASTNVFNVKSAGAETRELATLKHMHDAAFGKQEFINRFWAILEGINFFMLTRILIVAIGVLLLANGQLTLGELYFFQFSFYRVLTPFEMLGGMLPQWRRSIGKVRMMHEVLDRTLEPGALKPGVTLSTVRGHIVFEDVCFSYQPTHAIPPTTQALPKDLHETDAPAEPHEDATMAPPFTHEQPEHRTAETGDEREWKATIDHLSLTIEPGEHIALVGHSGAGKSTIAMLLNRFYEPTHGRILVDGKDLERLDVAWWRSQIGLVLQESLMFNDSILHNIRYARPDATFEEVRDAARRASAADFIERLPQGYDTIVGERGVKLSGGERQRLAIARAILKNPTIVILDEATSALDSLTERNVQEGIKELITGRTAIIIAHRLSTVRSVDRIAILEKGRLVAVAPHELLLTQSDLYRQMVELQQGGVLPE